MHSMDPQKSSADFQKEFERTLATPEDGVANFSGVVFPSAKYAKRRFSIKCLFNQAVFNCPADFMGATFTETAIFSEAVFFERAYFQASKFLKEAVFAWARLTHGADFSMAHFTQDAKFHEARFDEDATFNGAEFKQDADFNSTIFISNVYFNVIRPTTAMGSQGVTNKDSPPIRSPFIPTVFDRKVNFHGVTFGKRLEYRQTRFRGDGEPEPGPIFSLARFDNPRLVVFYDTDLTARV